MQSAGIEKRRTELYRVFAVALTAVVATGCGGCGGGSGGQYCMSDQQCPVGFECVYRQCVQMLDGGADTEVTDSVQPDAEVADVPADEFVLVECNPPCPGLQVCDPATLTCRSADICLSDEDCLGGMRCIQGECVSEAPPHFCEDDQDCQGNGQCDTVTGECVNKEHCSTEEDCAGTYVCYRDHCVECVQAEDCPGPNMLCTELHRCAEPPGLCEVDADCLDGRICQQGGCVYDECLPDEFAGNETRAEAAPVGHGVHKELTIIQDEEDWYSVWVPAGHSMLAAVTYDGAHGELELTLFHRNQYMVLAHSQGANGYARVALGRSQGDDLPYLLRVRLAEGTVCQYTLEIMIHLHPFCPNDSFEPNNTYEQAATLPKPRKATRLIEGLQVCAGDEDWYALKIPESAAIHAEVGYLEELGIIEMDLRDRDGQTIIDPALGAHNLKVLESDPLKPGTYFLEVRGASSEVEGAYYLSYQILWSCSDAFEPNDWFLEAQAVSADNYPALYMCEEGDLADWFVATVPVGRTLKACVTYIQSDTGLVVEVQEWDGTVLGEAPPEPGAAGQVTLCAHSLEAVTLEKPLYVHVGFADGMEGADLEYSLTVSLPEPTCKEDEDEDDDSFAEARDQWWEGVTGHNNGTFCGDEGDYIELTLEQGETLGLTLSYWPLEEARPYVQLGLYGAPPDPDPPLVVGQDSSESELWFKVELEHLVKTTGLYHIRVWGQDASEWDFTPYEYDLFIERRVRQSCAVDEDAFEEEEDEEEGEGVGNDFLFGAKEIPNTAGSPWDPLVACAGDPDWYLFYVDDEKYSLELTVEVLEPDPESLVTVEVLGALGEQKWPNGIAQLDVDSDGELEWNYFDGKPGIYYLRIGVNGPSTAEYTLEYTVTPTQ